MDFERIENLLEDFERPTISVLEKLRDLKTITSEEKATFSFYIVQMYRRMPRHREDLAKTFPKVLVELEPEVRENFRLPNTQETKDLFEKILERTKAPDYQTRVHLDVIANTRTSRVMKIVEGMKWRFFIAPKGQKYFTSDDPVFYFKDLGLLRSESEVSFPLSTDVALVASQSEKVREGFFPATLQIVKELNRRTASRTLQRAYFWRPEPWVLNLLNKSTYQLAPLVS